MKIKNMDCNLFLFYNNICQDSSIIIGDSFDPLVGIFMWQHPCVNFVIVNNFFFAVWIKTKRCILGRENPKQMSTQKIWTYLEGHAY